MFDRVTDHCMVTMSRITLGVSRYECHAPKGLIGGVNRQGVGKEEVACESEQGNGLLLLGLLTIQEGDRMPSALARVTACVRLLTSSFP
jgi:hypothetical protein